MFWYGIVFFILDSHDTTTTGRVRRAPAARRRPCPQSVTLPRAPLSAVVRVSRLNIDRVILTGHCVHEGVRSERDGV
eukprot:4337526-Pleurochrysis_carterae.AAC.1